MKYDFAKAADRNGEPPGGDTKTVARLQQVRGRIAAACAEAGRDPASVHLIAVSKYHPPEQIRTALDAGVCCLGENHVQELLAKQLVLTDWGYRPAWHLIGTLQRNKVRQVVGRVALIHSVDSLQLLAEIAKRAAVTGVIQPILIQINFSGADHKHGFSKEAASALLAGAADWPQLQIRGLMTMAEADWDDTVLDRFFGDCHSYYKEQQALMADRGRTDFDVLSMGMSHDYVHAIRHGATHIRVGTAIFGPRVYPL